MLHNLFNTYSIFSIDTHKKIQYNFLSNFFSYTFKIYTFKLEHKTFFLVSNMNYIKSNTFFGYFFYRISNYKEKYLKRAYAYVRVKYAIVRKTS